jgi:hypothetical protein
MSGLLNLTSICDQRKQQLLFNKPLPRYTPISPYPQFTQDQLNMRRKAEILKYGNNTSSSKTNNLTRKEQWAKISNAKYSGNTLFCPSDIYLPTLSSSCDVPGPIVVLQNDPTVPLYNFVTKTASYASDNTTEDPNYLFILDSNILVNSNSETEIAKLNIKNNQNVNVHQFSISTPFCFHISGSNISPTGPLDLQILINSMSVINYYSGVESLALNGVPTYQYSTMKTPIQLRLTPPNTTTPFSFSAFVYGGMLNLSNINLYTSPGYIYDIKLSFNPTLYSTNTTNTSLYNNTTVSMYANITSDLYNDIVSPNGMPFGNRNPYNCLINRGISKDSYLPVSLTSNYAQMNN